MRYPCLIIDDDPKSIKETEKILENFPDFFLAGKASDDETALHLILKKRPQVIFIEIDPINKSSNLSFSFLDHLQRFVKLMPKVIIVTKTKAFAFEAIKYGVTDYLLKPLDVNEVRKTFVQLERKLHEVRTTICLKSYGDYKFINAEDIIYLRADNNSTDFFTINGEVTTAYKTLKYFEYSMPNQFLRIHNSYIINLNYVSRIHMGGNLCYIKNSTIKLPFTKFYRKNVEYIVKLLLIQVSRNLEINEETVLP